MPDIGSRGQRVQSQLCQASCRAWACGVFQDALLQTHAIRPGFSEKEDAAGVIPHIFVVLVSYTCTVGNNAISCFCQKLNRFLVHIYDRVFGIIWTAVHLKDVFHRCDERRVIAGWYAPALLQMKLVLVFLECGRPVGKKTKRPLGISLGRISAGESYDMSLDVSGNLGLYWRRLPFLSLDGCVESLLPITSPDVLDCSGRRVEGYGSLLHSHRLFPIPVYREKDVGSQDGSRRHIAGLHNLGQLFALLCRQAHLVLLNRYNRIVLCVIRQDTIIFSFIQYLDIIRC